MPPLNRRRLKVCSWPVRLVAASVVAFISYTPCFTYAQQAESTTTQPQVAVVQYPISQFDFEYFSKDTSGLPGIEQLKSDVYVRITPNGQAMEAGGQAIRLGELPAGNYSREALVEIANGIVRHLNSRGFFAVKVGWTPDQINPVTNEDRRSPDNKQFKFLVLVPKITDVRTLALGDRIAAVRRVGAAEHSSILTRSPLQSSQPGKEAYFTKNQLDDYIFALNRHPGRRVDVAVSSGQEAGDLTLDYLISESRPWYFYAQVSNTGTKSTNEWRERFGFTHNQLTGHDDIFSIDYSTAGFEDSHSVSTSYDFPIQGSYELRGRVFASWSNFTASDVGLVDQEFEGTEWSGGGELAWNFLQRREAFVDLIAGFRYQNVEIDNRVDSISVTNGEAAFWQPYVGLRFQRVGDTANTFASATVNYGFTDADQIDLDALRQSADDTFWTISASASHSFYLEPLLNRNAFADGSSTLAHEIYVSARGQYAFGDRLIPQVEETAGGLYSVRGYPESITAGDNVIIGTLEYRFHLSRALARETEPGNLFGKPFRWRPQDAYGRPDWDFIIRPFIDYARITNSDRLPFENDNTLVGAGVGVELQVLNNFNARVDWGMALTDVETSGSEGVDAGDHRFGVSFTFVY